MGRSWRTDVLHLIAGLVVAISGSAFVGFDGYFFIDEAALYGQLEVMEGDGWTVPRPFPDRDPSAEHVPMARSDTAGDEYAPFAKHPVHVLVARAAHLAGGEIGVRMLSSLSLVVAAVAAAVLAGGNRLRRRTAFWLTLVASPLLFDSNLVVAHTLGAAVAGALFATALRCRRSPASHAAVFVLALLGGLLRNELLLLVGAGAVVLGLRALRRRSSSDALVASTMLVGAGAAYIFEPLLVRRAIGAGAGLETAPTAGAAARDVVTAATRSLFEVNASAATTTGILGLVVCGVLVAVTAVLAARREPDRQLVLVVAGLALVASVVFLAQPHLVTGLVWAFPGLLLLIAAASGGFSLDDHIRTAALASALFAVLVAATQYSQGGGLEWGWRYVAVAIPLLTPAVAQVVAYLWRDRRTGVPGLALGAVLVASIVVQLGGLRFQRAVVSDTDYFLVRVDEVMADASADWVVSTDASFGRFAYQVSVEGDVATVANADIGQVLGWLRDDGVDTVLVVWRFDEPPPDGSLGGYRRTGRSWAVASDYRAVLLEPA